MAVGTQYRPDIDGLRALAVILVLLFHIRVGFVKGGLIGVDIFFVISGYLITSIIKQEAAAGTFSLLGFYERRVRRLFPALFAVLACSCVAAYFYLFPTELEYFGETLVAATLFVANLLFYQGEGYFDGTRRIVPLFHTWSLAVEEQFYLLYPLLLAPLVRRKPASVPLVLAVIAAVSFALSIYLIKHDRSAAFFLFPPRAWELLVGCLLAVGAVPELARQSHRQIASAVAFVAILVAAGTINRNVPFPGWAVVVPCLAAAVLIHTGRQGDTFVYRLLTLKPVIFIGLVSYSLYLWHWPIIVFYRAAFGYVQSDPEKALLAAVSIAAAVVSWRYVERPFRTRRLAAGRRKIFAAAAVASVTTVALAGVFYQSGGLPGRIPEDVRQLATFKYVPAKDYRSDSCFISRAKPRLGEDCLRSETGRKNYLLIGDSLAAHLWPGLTDTFPEINFLQATSSGCAPLVDDRGAPRCRAIIDHIYKVFLRSNRVDGIILSADWKTEHIPGLLKTVQEVGQYTSNVYVFGPIVGYLDLLPRLLTRSALQKDPSLVVRGRLTELALVDKAMAQAMAGKGGKYVSVYQALCNRPGGDCMTLDGAGNPIQFDNRHLTKTGSDILSGILRGQGVFEEAGLRGH